jgi:NADH-quinone oxidoreductase subunit M
VTLVEITLATAFAGGLLVFLLDDERAPTLAFGLSLVPLLASVLMWLRFDGRGNVLLDGGVVAFETVVPWLTLGPYALSWHVGVDGISLPLVLLTTVLTPLAILSAWTPIQQRQSQFYGLVLVIEAGLLGVFVALDFFVWFVFWEAVLIPMYLLIAVWGGPRREYAAIKFLIYTNVASLVMFIGFMGLVFGLGDAVSSFDLPAIAEALRTTSPDALPGVSAGTLKTVAFVAMFAGFGVKVPIVPFHTWLPDAHVEAPTPASVILAGVLLKMGTYALLRFNFTMLVDVAQAFAIPIAVVAVVSVIYGAMLALAQQDLKRIVAYSSISSMGYVILGLVAFTTYGLGGATFQMLSHGLLSGLLFMVVGVIYNATHTRMVGDLSGLADRMPITVAVFVAGAFGYMGLPLMSGFVAELFVFLGAFGAAFPYAPAFTALAMFGIVIVAGYLLYAMQRTLFGEYRVDTDYDAVPAPFHDVAPLVVLVLIVVALGVAPDLFFGMIQDAVNPIVDLAGGGA